MGIACGSHGMVAHGGVGKGEHGCAGSLDTLDV